MSVQNTEQFNYICDGCSWCFCASLLKSSWLCFNSSYCRSLI